MSKFLKRKTVYTLDHARFRMKRRAGNVTIDQVSAKSKIAKSFISTIERGQHVPREKTARRLSDALTGLLEGRV